LGEVAFKGEILKGEQPAIFDRTLFDAVQAKLDEQNNNHNIARMKSEALLLGRIFDDRGNRMSPSHARKRGIKYRYYLSSALLDGGPQKPDRYLACQPLRSRGWWSRLSASISSWRSPTDDAAS